MNLLSGRVSTITVKFCPVKRHFKWDIEILFFEWIICTKFVVKGAAKTNKKSTGKVFRIGNKCGEIATKESH